MMSRALRRLRAALQRHSYLLAFVLLLLVAALAWFWHAPGGTAFALRNTLVYHFDTWRVATFGAPPPAPIATMTGCVRNQQGDPIAGATVLVAEADGTAHTATSDHDGCYTLTAPAGDYMPVVAAAGYPPATVARGGYPVTLPAQHDITLPPVSTPAVVPGRDLRIGAPVRLSWDIPEPSIAQRHGLTFDSDGRPSQPTYLYLPDDPTGSYPVLLAVYPGPVDTWEGVSIPLAAAGYAVIAAGPRYSLDLDDDVAELQRLLAFARAGALPHADGGRIAVLGGSYSGLHVGHIMRRDAGLRGVVLLGAPADLFDLRRRFSAGTFSPPFGLDQAMIALGTPDQLPQRYWDYSLRYHVRGDLPPLLLMHSRNDEVVPFQQTELLVDALDEQGARYEAYFFDGMSHYLLADRPSPELDALYRRTTDFLAAVLVPVPPEAGDE